MTTENCKNIKSKIIDVAQNEGYDYAILFGEWNGYDVYAPIYWTDEKSDGGISALILLKDDEIRLTKDKEEVFKVIKEAKKYLADEAKNKPLELEQNISVKSFKFSRGGAGGNYMSFEYKSNKKGNILTYTEEGDYYPSLSPAKVKIADERFDEYALGMIKYFHEGDGGQLGFCGGEWYEFEATLSDGNKLKSSGYNYFPFGYNKFITFLEHYWDDRSNIIEYLPMKNFENEQ